MFVFVFLYVTAYFFFIEKYKSSLFIMLPAFVIYFLVSGLQYNVGTDYFSYVDIYIDEDRRGYYFDKGEYFFYYIVVGLNKLNLPAQSLFLVFSIIQSLFIFIYFKLIKKRDFVVWIFFISFFCVTNIYNNQLNGLRQYVVVCLLPILTVFLYEKRFFTYIFLVFMASLFHDSAIFLIILIPVRVFLRFFYNKELLIFIIAPFVYYFISFFLVILISVFAPEYVHYLSSDIYSKSNDLSLFYTKIYYIPAVLYFLYIYRYEENKPSYFGFMTVVFSFVYWFFILGVEIDIANRMFSYFIFFYSFPVYFILKNSYVKNKVLEFIVILTYTVLPYLAKITFFSKAEFLYKSIIFN